MPRANTTSPAPGASPGSRASPRQRGVHGFDGHKPGPGRTRQRLVDTLGVLLAVVGTARRPHRVPCAPPTVDGGAHRRLMSDETIRPAIARSVWPRFTPKGCEDSPMKCGGATSPTPTGTLGQLESRGTWCSPPPISMLRSPKRSPVTSCGVRTRKPCGDALWTDVPSVRSRPACSHG